MEEEEEEKERKKIACPLMDIRQEQSGIIETS